MLLVLCCWCCVADVLLLVLLLVLCCWCCVAAGVVLLLVLLFATYSTHLMLMGTEEQAQAPLTKKMKMAASEPVNEFSVSDMDQNDLSDFYNSVGLLCDSMMLYITACTSILITW